MRSAYRDPQDSPFVRFLTFLSGTVRLGRWFGVEVRLFWIAGVLTPLIAMSWLRHVTGSGLELLLLTTFVTVALFTIVWTHEMGHVRAGRRYGIRTPLITLSPLGGLAHMGASAPNPRSEARIALSGPAVHLLWLAVCWPLQLLLPWGTVHVDGFTTDPVALGLAMLVQTNLALLVFNLLPFFPMDGGRVLRAVLSGRMHPNRATMIATAIGIAGGIGIAIYGLTLGEVYAAILFMIGVNNVLACLQERAQARHMLVYDRDADRREAWQTDPDFWRQGGAQDEPRPRRPGLLTRLRARRAQARWARQRAREAELEAELDRVLARLHEVGQANLSARERKVLQRAAARRRRGSDTG